MKNLWKIFLFVIAFVLPCTQAASQVQFGVPKKMSNSILRISSFYDYYPLGSTASGIYEGLLDTFLKDFQTFANFSAEMYRGQDYEETIRTGAKGKSDIILGMYSDTSIYGDLKFIYPAAIDNPVHLVMLPSKISAVKKISDLKNMKGAIDSREYWSDFVKDQMQNFNLEKIDNSYDLYGKLLRGEIDYIFTTYWFGSIEMMKLGVRDLVTLSKKSIWSMPVFIGISKISMERDYLSHNLTQWLSRQEVRDKIKNRAIEILQKVEEETRGTVPPSYILEQPKEEAKTPVEEKNNPLLSSSPLLGGPLLNNTNN